MDWPVIYQYVEPFNVLAMTEEIFTEKVQSAARRLAPFALSFTGNEEEAQRLLQETYYRAIANWESYNGTMPVNDWLLGIMCNIHKAGYERKPQQESISAAHDLGHQTSGIDPGKKRNLAGRLRSSLMGTGSYLQDILKLGFQQYYLGYVCQDMLDALRQSMATLKNKLYGAHKED